MGSGPLAILAGFSLSAALAVAQRPRHSLFHDVAIACFGLSVASLVVTLMLVVSSQMYWASPEQRLAWRPEALVSLEVLEAERKKQLEDYRLLVNYIQSISISFEIGLIATLLGLASALLAEHPRWGSDLAAGFMIAVAATVVLWHYQRPKSMFPSPEQVQATPIPLDELGVAAMMGSPTGSVHAPGNPALLLKERAAAERLESLLTDCLDALAIHCDGTHPTATSVVGDRLAAGTACPVVEIHVLASDARGLRCSFSVANLARAKNEKVEDTFASISQLVPSDEVGGLGYLCWIQSRQELEAVLG